VVLNFENMSETPDNTLTPEVCVQGAVPDPADDVPTAPLPAGDNGPHAEDIDQHKAGIAIVGALASGETKSKCR
jgi:hypothetical protein